MITSNGSYPFGGRITTISTPSFKCTISTAREGIFKPLSTMVMNGDITDGTARNSACGKLIYSSALRKEDIQNIHANISLLIDRGGEDGDSLGVVLERIFSELREKNLVFEAINLAD